jgi:hypothetical protein
MRKGAPFHGASGEASSVSPTSSAQLADAPFGPWGAAAALAPINAPALSSRAGASAANWRAENN